MLWSKRHSWKRRKHKSIKRDAVVEEVDAVVDVVKDEDEAMVVEMEGEVAEEAEDVVMMEDEGEDRVVAAAVVEEDAEDQLEVDERQSLVEH